MALADVAALPPERAMPAVIGKIAAQIQALRPLLDVLDRPVRLGAPGALDAASPGAMARGQACVDVITQHLGIGQLTLSVTAGPADLGPFECIVNQAIDVSPLIAGVAAGGHMPPAEIAACVDRSRDREYAPLRTPLSVVSADGAIIRAYAAGVRWPGRPAVVLASACGMPVGLSEPWLRCLAASHLVLTWESRGLFGQVTNFDDLACDAAAQAADLFEVMAAYGVQTAHVMGFCTGAVIALAAAGAEPGRVSSLSLWHGTYELGTSLPKTPHQRDMHELMSFAATGEAAAGLLHDALCQAMLRTHSDKRSPISLYPYATSQLLYRYCRVNGSVAATDLSDLIGVVDQPVLVVSSETDDTTHPQGSVLIAEMLKNARLHMEPTGNHLSLFQPSPQLQAVARDFLAEVA
jgi:3-oxoadipate enol-lactonase